MTTRQFAETGIPSKGPGVDDDSMVVISTPIDTILAGDSQGPVVVDDMNAERFTNAVVGRTYFLQVANLSPGTQFNGIEAITPEIATIDSGGYTHYVSDGDAIFVVKSSMGNRTVTLDHYINGGETIDEFVSWVSGSAAQDAADAVDDAIDSKDPVVAMPLYTLQDHAGGGTYERNDACWANTWRAYLTCISPWNSTGSHLRAGTAITPRHIIFANHYPIGVGATVRFVTSGDVVEDRTMVSSEYIPDSDFRIGLLSSDLPATITPCLIMADEVETKLPNLIHRIPTLGLDYQEKAIVSDWYRADWYNVMNVPTDQTRLDFYETKIVGDSGNPCFAIIGGRLVLLTTWYGGGEGGWGYATQDNLTEIQSTIDTLGNFGHSIDVVDLSSYPDY